MRRTSQHQGSPTPHPVLAFILHPQNHFSGGALNKFITNDYVVGADANAAAKDDKGAGVGAIAKWVAPTSAELPSKVNVYEITEKGLAAQAINTQPDDTRSGCLTVIQLAQ